MLLILLLVEFVYLVLVNTALYLPVTQDLVNRIRPDKFQVSWERAWSWYPTRVHARGVNEKPGPVPGLNTTCGRS